MCASCLRRLRPVLICETHSLETCPLNHAQPAASTPLLATSFCMEGEPGDVDVDDHRVYPGQPPPRRDPASSALRRPPYVWRGGAAWHIRLTNVFDLPSIDVAAAPAAPTARAYAGRAGAVPTRATSRPPQRPAVRVWTRSRPPTSTGKSTQPPQASCGGIRPSAPRRARQGPRRRKTQPAPTPRALALHLGRPPV
jgi:hypothetical protein